MDNLNNTDNQNLPAEKDFEFLGDPTKSAAPKKQNGFNKKLAPVIALVCVAAVLFASFFILKSVVPNNNDITTEQKENTIELTDLNGSSAQTLHIKNSLDEFTFVRRLEKTYYIEGKESFAVQNSLIITALTSAGKVVAQTEVEKGVTDFEQYGLKEPIATVRWTKGDTTHYFELGDIAPSGNYYMRFNGGDTVYTYSAQEAASFLTTRMDYYDTSVFAYDASTDAPYITEFSIYKKGATPLVCELQDLTDEEVQVAYLIKEPIEHHFSSEKYEMLNEFMSALTSLTVFSDDISEQNLKKYGLLDPEYTFSFTNVAVKNTIHFGKTADEGYVYAYAEGKDFIYIIDKAAINILTYKITDYCDAVSYTRSYETVNSIDIVGGGKTYHIDITGTADDGDLKAYINNKYVEYQNFSSLYAHLISINITGITNNPGGEPLVTVKVNTKDGKTDVLKYYKISELNSFYELNGKGMLQVPTSSVEKILTFAQQLYDGKEIILEW